MIIELMESISKFRIILTFFFLILFCFIRQPKTWLSTQLLYIDGWEKKLAILSNFSFLSIFDDVDGHIAWIGQFNFFMMMMMMIGNHYIFWSSSYGENKKKNIPFQCKKNLPQEKKAISNVWIRFIFIYYIWG